MFLSLLLLLLLLLEVVVVVAVGCSLRIAAVDVIGFGSRVLVLSSKDVPASVGSGLGGWLLCFLFGVVMFVVVVAFVGFLRCVFDSFYTGLYSPSVACCLVVLCRLRLRHPHPSHVCTTTRWQR